MKTNILLTAISLLVSMPLTATTPQSAFQTQCASSRMMWASVNGLSNASLGDYTAHTNKLLISWRMLPTDSWDTSFLLYWRTASSTAGMMYRITPTPVSSSTCYQTDLPAVDRVCYLLPGDYFGDGSIPSYITSAEDKAALKAAALDSVVIDQRLYSQKLPYISIPLKGTDEIFDPDSMVYQANDVSIGDLDGDGQMEIVVKRLQSLKDASGNIISDGTGAAYSHRDCLYAVIWDAYKLDGTFLWRVKGGPGIILGNSSSFAVADFDGDGCAEMAIRTCEGTVFGDGAEIPDTDGDGRIDYRTWGNQYSSSPGWIDHYNSAGPEFISIIDGKTGAELARADFISRDTSSSWGDGYWKRACSFRVGVGCFDQTGLPSAVFGRGVYARSVIEAWDYRDGQLTRRWHFDTSAAGSGKDGNANSTYAAQGNHSMNIADLDGDGLDEVMYGSMALDDDGIGLWNTQLGHGDANFVGKFLPDRDGLQMFHCLEGGKTMIALHDAKDGATIWSKVADSDNDMGRCMVADYDPDHAGCEFCYYKSDLFDQDGNSIGISTSDWSLGFAAAIWFDGSLVRQGLTEKATIHSLKYGRTFTLYRYDMAMINGTKGNPSWYGDLLGDWREEVIVPDASKVADLKIFSTWYPTAHKFPFLMSDHTYMMQCLNQNIGYNQPNNLGYFLGTGMDLSQVPLQTTAAIEDVTPSYLPSDDNDIHDLMGRQVSSPRSGLYIQGRRTLFCK
ncbi:MAG: hypothetical protein K6E86_07915 [Bacteroidales bacterium]|nr:hypothetical protein [Bacteroidales bacterium]